MSNRSNTSCVGTNVASPTLFNGCARFRDSIRAVSGSAAGQRCDWLTIMGPWRLDALPNLCILAIASHSFRKTIRSFTNRSNCMPFTTCGCTGSPVTSKTFIRSDKFYDTDQFSYLNTEFSSTSSERQVPATQVLLPASPSRQLGSCTPPAPIISTSTPRGAKPGPSPAVTRLHQSRILMSP